MVEVKEENGVIHLYLKETLAVKHEEERKRRGRPREEIPDVNAVSQKTLEDLKSGDFMERWEALSEVLKACGSYRKTERWLREYCPSLPTSRRQMAKILKSFEKMKEEARKSVKKLLERAKENPYLTDVELESAIEEAIKEFTRQRIRQSSPKFPVGTRVTDEKGLNIREWGLRKEAQKREKQ